MIRRKLIHDLGLQPGLHWIIICITTARIQPASVCEGLCAHLRSVACQRRLCADLLNCWNGLAVTAVILTFLLKPESGGITFHTY